MDDRLEINKSRDGFERPASSVSQTRGTFGQGVANPYGNSGGRMS